jgi:hypothetical protein
VTRHGSAQPSMRVTAICNHDVIELPNPIYSHPNSTVRRGKSPPRPSPPVLSYPLYGGSAPVTPPFQCGVCATNSRSTSAKQIYDRNALNLYRSMELAQSVTFGLSGNLLKISIFYELVLSQFSRLKITDCFKTLLFLHFYKKHFFSRFYTIFCPQNKAHPVPTPYIVVCAIVFH